MKFASIYLVATTGFSASYEAAPSAANYGPSPAYDPYSPTGQHPHGYAPAPANYGPPATGTGYEHPVPVYKTPAPVYNAKHDAKQHSNQYWDNQLLCNAEFDYTSCLLNAVDRKTFFDDSRIEKCTVDFVKGLCGKLSKTKTGQCDNGDIKLDAKNCPTAAFADALLVFNKLTYDLENVLELSGRISKWSFITTKLSLAAVRNNADCVINSFFNYLNQCKVSKLVSEKDNKCVDTYLEKAHCKFAEEDGHGWNLPELVTHFGHDGAASEIQKLKNEYNLHKDEKVAEKLVKILKDTADEHAQGIRFIESVFEHKLKKSTLNVCPEAFMSMNALFSTEGMKGLPEDKVFFHFPIDKETEYQPTKHENNIKVNDGEIISAPLDPYTDKSIYETCANFFDTSKLLFQADPDQKVTNQCYSISSHSIHFVESGIEKNLFYEVLEGKTTKAAPDGGMGDQCYAASWAEAKTCSSHLTEWQMTVACCKSYQTVHEEHTKKIDYDAYGAPIHHDASYYNTILLKDETYPTSYQSPNAQNNNAQYNYNGQTPTGYVPHPSYPVVPATQYKSVSPKDLVYELTVKSNSKQGKLGTIDSVEVVDDEAVNVDSIKALAEKIKAEWVAKCSAIDMTELKKVSHGTYGKNVYDNCLDVLAPASTTPSAGNTLLQKSTMCALDAYECPGGKFVSRDPTNNCQFPMCPPAHEYILHKHPLYVGDNYQSKKICQELQIHLDFTEIIPIVSGKCYPQACILSQLASCMEIPEEKNDYKYDYDHTPKHETNTYGYPTHYGQQSGHPSNGYSLLSATSAAASGGNMVAFASVGFVAGVAVIAIAQTLVARRNTGAVLQHLV